MLLVAIGTALALQHAASRASPLGYPTGAGATEAALKSIAARALASGEAGIDAYAAQLNGTGLVPGITFVQDAGEGGTGTVAKPPALAKTASGGGGAGAVTVTGLPAGSYAAVLDASGTLVAYAAAVGGTATMNVPAQVSNGCVAAYVPSASRSWRYPAASGGTAPLSASNTYAALPSGAVLTQQAWSPPAGFNYVVVSGLPPLSLAVVTQGGAPAGAAAADAQTGCAQVYAPGLPFTGAILCMQPAAYASGTVSGGDAYEYG